LTPSRVLVTGARGFIGKRLVEALLRRGYEVHGITSSPPAAIGETGIHWHEADLLDPVVSLPRLMEGIGARGLVHLAWYVAHGKYWEAPENYAWQDRSLELLRAFRQAGGERALCAGTCAEYDYGVEGPYREDRTPVNPRTIYGACKDRLHRGAREIPGLSLCWARLFHLYGPGELPTRLWPKIHGALASGQGFTLQWPNRRRAFLHVADAAEALSGLLGSAFQGAVNVGSPETTTLGDLALAIARRLGREGLLRFEEPEGRGSEPLDLTPDLGLLFSNLAWKPRYSTTLGVEELVRTSLDSGGA